MLCVASVLGGCDEQDFESDDFDVEAAELGDVEHRLNGVVDFGPGCTDAERDRVEEAMELILAAFNSGDDYVDCVKSALMTGDDGLTAEAIVRRLRENMPTRVNCAAEVCDRADAVGCAPVDISTESIALQKAYLANADLDSIAGVIIHEVAHNKGLNHPLDWFEPDSRFRAIRQAQECVRTGEPDGLLRTEAAGDTELARVGGAGGQPFELACPGGEVGRGLSVDSSFDHVNRLRLRCDVSSTGSRGSWKDSVWSRTRTCGAGDVLVGVRGRAGSMLGRLEMMCADEDDVIDENLALSSQVWLGGVASSGDAFERRCPAGMVVKRLRGRSGARIDQLQVGCEAYPTNARGPNQVQPILGSAVGSPIEQHCLGFGALTGLWGSAGGEVDRIGGRCVSTFTSWFGTPQLDVGSDVQGIEAVGGAGGSNFDDACPQGQAIVGVRGKAGARLGRVRAICADVAKWNNPSTSAPLHYTPYRGAGPSVGTYASRMCARGSYVVGLKTWASKTVHATPTVNGVAPVCRRLGVPMVVTPWW